MINKYLLHELYFTKNLTVFEIAEIYQVDKVLVCQWLESYGFPVKDKRKYSLINKTPLTPEQKEFVVGALLGKSKIFSRNSNKSFALAIEHKEEQKDFLLWKKKILGNLVNVINKTKDGYAFNTASHDEMKFFHNLFYQNNKKIVRPEVINYITPLSIAVWFSDDGSIKNDVNIRLSTSKFSKKETELLQEMFWTKFEIASKICTYTRYGKEYYYLSFNRENSEKLTKLINPYVVDCMRYKLINCSSTTECQTSEKKSDEDIV